MCTQNAACSKDTWGTSWSSAPQHPTLHQAVVTPVALPGTVLIADAGWGLGSSQGHPVKALWNASCCFKSEPVPTTSSFSRAAGRTRCWVLFPQLSSRHHCVPPWRCYNHLLIPWFRKQNSSPPTALAASQRWNSHHAPAQKNDPKSKIPAVENSLRTGVPSQPSAAEPWGPPWQAESRWVPCHWVPPSSSGRKQEHRAAAASRAPLEGLWTVTASHNPTPPWKTEHMMHIQPRRPPERALWSPLAHSAVPRSVVLLCPHWHQNDGHGSPQRGWCHTSQRLTTAPHHSPPHAGRAHLDTPRSQHPEAPGGTTTAIPRGWWCISRERRRWALTLAALEE